MFPHTLSIPLRLGQLVFINFLFDRSREVRGTQQKQKRCRRRQRSAVHVWSVAVRADSVSLRLPWSWWFSFLCSFFRPGFICLCDVCRLFCMPPRFHSRCMSLQGCIPLFSILFTRLNSRSFCQSWHQLCLPWFSATKKKENLLCYVCVLARHNITSKCTFTWSLQKCRNKRKNNVALHEYLMLESKETLSAHF